MVEEHEGEYKGIESIEFAHRVMFQTKDPVLGCYFVKILQWDSFISAIEFTAIEASQPLQRNFLSNLGVVTRKENYEYITAQIFDVIILFNAIERYRNRYPRDTAVTRLKLDEKLRFKNAIDNFVRLDPAPEMRRPEPRSQTGLSI